MRTVSGTEARRGTAWIWAVAGLALSLALPVAAQTAGNQNQQAPANSQQADDIPDAPSTVQPPAPKPLPQAQPSGQPATGQNPQTPGETQGLEPGASSSRTAGREEERPATPQMPPIETLPPNTPAPQNVPEGRLPHNQLDPTQGLYVIPITANLVQLPVMVKSSDGRRVDGLLPKDFTVLENGKPQKLTYFTSDPFLLSVAVVLDLGMADVALQKVNQTYGSLVGAFSPYDEFALYTYSSTVSQVTDFTNNPERLNASLDQMKTVRGHYNGPPVLSGPLAMGPTVNGAPVGGPIIAPVNTPPKEAFVLNDAILRAALDLSKRPRERRKVILVISDGRERGSQASYKEVLRVLQTHGIQLKAVVLDMGALPGYKQAEKLHHVFRQGYDDILPKYSSATGGGGIFTELTRNTIEDAYTEITSEARNQYTLGYSPKPIPGASPYRSIEILIDKRGLKIYAKDGYYFIPSVRQNAGQPSPQ